MTPEALIEQAIVNSTKGRIFVDYGTRRAMKKGIEAIQLMREVSEQVGDVTGADAKEQEKLMRVCKRLWAFLED